MHLRYFLPAIVLVGLVVLFGYNLVDHHDPRLVPSPLIGKPAPAFDLPTLSGVPAKLSAASLKGKPAVINFFASWCTACKIEHPFLMRMAREDGVAIIGVDYKDTNEAVTQDLARRGNPYRHVVLDRDGSMGLNWGVYGVPETFVVDAQGVVRYKCVGPLTPAIWRKHVQPLLQTSRG